MKFKPFQIIIAVIACGFIISRIPKSESTDYLSQRANFKSNITDTLKAPQDYPNLETNDDVIKTAYPSNGAMLLGLLSRQNLDSGKRKPVMVYLHGGFSLSEGDVANCDYFMKQGYIVFAPTYRGENGNDGFFEFFMDEVDDAKAAVKWIAHQPFADSNKIYVFGHSIGGGIAALLSLQKDVPIAFSGSSGGLYSTGSFDGWADIVPFDKNNPMERKMRVLVDNIPSMQMNHYAFIGKEDKAEYRLGTELTNSAANSKLNIFFEDGDHFTSLEPAMAHFVAIINTSK